MSVLMALTTAQLVKHVSIILALHQAVSPIEHRFRYFSTIGTESAILYYQCASQYCYENDYLEGKSKLVEVENKWDPGNYDCNSYGYCLDGVYLKGVCTPGMIETALDG